VKTDCLGGKPAEGALLMHDMGQGNSPGILRIRWGILLLLAVQGWGMTIRAAASVDLRLQPRSSVFGREQTVPIDLIARADDGGNEAVSGLSVVLSWDASILELTGFANNPAYSWLFSGFLDDAEADGLNDSLADGDAFFQAAGQFTVPAVIPPEGFTITTLMFQALSGAECTEVQIEPSAGAYSRTEIFRFGVISEDITGSLGAAKLRIVDGARLWVPQTAAPRGGTSEVVVYGQIGGQSTYGVTIMAELVPSTGSVGSLVFTPAPPVDIHQVGDPWPGAGLYTAFDTDGDGTSSPLLNGSVDDNGTYRPSALVYWGPLTALPIVAGPQAAGTWEVRLQTAVGASGWEGLETELAHGTLQVVDRGDGNASQTIDLRDFSELQRCYTGSYELPARPPLYSTEPWMRCPVYDFDADGDIGDADYAAFHAAMEGPNG
jgi:hypothetical protein